LVRINEKEQIEIFTKLVKKFRRDFSKASEYLGISNSSLSNYKTYYVKYIPEDTLMKAITFLGLDKPLVLERGTLTEIRSRYMRKAHSVLANKYGNNWAKELTRRRDYKGFHLKDFPDYIFVYLKDSYRKKLLQSAYNLAGGLEKLSKIINISPSRLSYWYRGKQKDYKRDKTGLQFIPLLKLKLISDILVKDNNYNFSMEEIEKNVVMYRMRAGNPIKALKFPIKESPELVRLLFHLLGDGYSGNKKDMANYKNTSVELLAEFKNDLKIFGEVPVYEQEYSIKFPRVIAEIIEDFYGVNSKTFESKITSKIIGLPKKYLYHGVRAFADDEGSVGRASVILVSANHNLLTGIKKILDLLSLRTSSIKTRFNPRATYKKIYTLDILDLKSYGKKVGFIHPKKREKLELYLRKKKSKNRKRLLKLKP
tara:strand:- start:358 stop:1632 length:1275 start_codon:yes stop_codon:yes gene_type:complete